MTRIVHWDRRLHWPSWQSRSSTAAQTAAPAGAERVARSRCCSSATTASTTIRHGSSRCSRGASGPRVSTSPTRRIPTDLNAPNLAKYDALMIYANHTSITPEQEKALLDFVAGGKGFLPIHCASFCFQNSPQYIALVGAQFLKHGTGEFTAAIIQPNHPVLDGVQPFQVWDETYVHTKINPDKTVLMERVDDERPRAVDVGPRAGQGPRLLHGLRPRRTRVGPPDVPSPRQERHPVGGRAGGSK